MTTNAKLAAELREIAARTSSFIDHVILHEAADRLQQVDWVKWDGSLYRKGDMCGGVPLPRGTLVDVMFRDKAIYYGLPLGENIPGNERGAHSSFWKHDEWDNDIIAYRIAKGAP